MRETLRSLMMTQAQQHGTTAAPLPEPGKQIAPAASAGQELRNGIETVPGEEAGVRNETATKTGTTGLGDALLLEQDLELVGRVRVRPETPERLWTSKSPIPVAYQEQETGESIPTWWTLKTV